jgi:hypothetical protein
MTHLTAADLVDAVDGVLDGTRHAHLEGCAACRAAVRQMTATLTQARNATIPEPSPLFWDHFSQRLHAAIADEPVSRAWPLWLRWPVLVPLAGLGVLVVAVIVSVPQNSPSRPMAPMVATGLDQAGHSDTDTDAAVDSAWAFIVESVGPLDVETAQQAGIAASPGEAERAALHLTDAEQAELVKLLQQELTRAGS